MKISSKGEYGIRALLYLATHDGDRPVPSRVIATEQNIPDAYLRQILAQLSRDGLVASTRGPRGGHRLAHTPDEISLFDIIRSLEGQTTSVDQALTSPCDVSSEPDAYVLREVLMNVKTSIDDILTETTLGQLARRYGEVVQDEDASGSSHARSTPSPAS